MSESEVRINDYSYEDLADFAKTWAEANDFTADMMQGIMQMGINSYEISYSGYSLAMQSYSNHEASKKED